MSICIVSLNDSPFTERSVVDLIKKAFYQWESAGLHSSLMKLDPVSFKKTTINGITLVAYEIDSPQDPPPLLGTMTFFSKTSRKNNEKYGYVSHLAVDPSSKGRGVATRLYGEAVRRLTMDSVSYVLSDTSINATWSIRWHLHQGFRIIGFTSFKTNNYYSYLFRHQLVYSKKWNNSIYVWCRFQLSRFRTLLIKKPDGSISLFGQIVESLLRQNG